GDAPTVPRVATDVQVREVAARLQLRGREELAVVVVEAESALPAAVVDACAAHLATEPRPVEEVEVAVSVDRPVEQRVAGEPDGTVGPSGGVPVGEQGVAGERTP